MINTLADIDDIPLTLASTVPGSIAIVAETGDKYILNLNRQWELIKSSNSSSGGDSGDIRYEGGDLMDEILDDSDINYDGGSLV